MGLLSVASLEDLQNRLADLPPADGQAAGACAAREPQLTKPTGSLGRLEEISLWLSTWQGHHPPTLDRPRAHVFAGNHGVAARGVSAYPPEVTRQMVLNFQAGGAAVNQLCRTFDTELAVHEIDLDRPTDDFTQGPAMSEADCIAAFNIGMRAVEPGSDLLCIGEMGIGNTTSAAALSMALFGGAGADWVGPGTGVVSEALAHKIAVVEQAVALHKGHGPLELLRRLGGRELAAMAGAVLAARLLRVPVLLDGYICTAAAAVLHCAVPGALDHCLAAHVSAEPAHHRLLGLLGKEPLLALGMRLGEASGAALAVGILKGAVACHTGMATFAEAGVSGK